ncbi:TPA: helix-turn-helix domain-containing protein [Streptococcus suis]|nr:helix-turn-helix transcriptional regulator [Streptococcus suis]HEM6112106.1 helix-turn-helix transcriptional regulator [Streptococcus suis]HEM6320464.1 helix-turn-helix transcriptional regulator [Streptococcus suis]
MDFNYNGLWKILIDKNMKKKDLIENIGISPTTISKMTKGEAISLSVLGKICKSLNADIGDVVNLIKTNVEDK